MLSSASLAAVSELPNRPPRPAKPAAALPVRPSDAWWVEPVARIAVVVFFGLLVLDVALPHVAGRLFWTVAVASLPLLFVIAGYHRWRRICPLAWIAQIPTRFGRAGHRRAGPWLQAHGYDVVVALLVVSLWLRLVATNGDGRALAAFLAAAVGRPPSPSASRSRARRGATTSVRSRLSRSSTPSRAGCATRRTRSAPPARPASRPAPTSTRRTATGRRSSRRPRHARTTRFRAWCWPSTPTTTCRRAPGRTTSAARGPTSRA